MSDKNLVPMGSNSFEDLRKVNEPITLPAPANRQRVVRGNYGV